MENTLVQTKKNGGVRVLFAVCAALAAAFFALHMYEITVCKAALYGSPRIDTAIVACVGLVLSAAVGFAGVRLLKTKRLLRLSPFIAVFGLVVSVLPVFVDSWYFFNRYLYIGNLSVYVPCFVMLTAFTAGLAGTYRKGWKWQSLPVTLILLALPCITLSVSHSIPAIAVVFFTWFFFMIALARGGRMQMPWYVLAGVSALFLGLFFYTVFFAADGAERLSTVFTRGQSDPLGAGYVRTLADQVMRGARIFGAADEKIMPTDFGALPLSLFVAHFEFPFELLFVLAKCGWVAFAAFVALQFVIPAALLFASRRAPNGYAKYFAVFVGVYLLGKTGLGLFSLLFSDISAPLPFFDYTSGMWIDIFLIFAAFTLLVYGETDLPETERVYDASVPLHVHLGAHFALFADETAASATERSRPGIGDLDKNFRADSPAQPSDGRWISVQEPPFEIHGVFYENGKFRRIPESLAAQVNQGVLYLHANTAGGRVRFATDSPVISIHAEMPGIARMPHFALTGSAGFDLYADNEYRGAFVPPQEITSNYESALCFPDAKLRQITIHFPLYSDVSGLWIRLENGASLLPPAPYADLPPVVYYGSSITQGGCASRPGLAYENILSRRLNADHVNLGFSGSAKGEQVMAEYIAGLEMSAFVLDYDHNAESPALLAATHAAFFETVRKAHPTLPILMLSRPKFTLYAEEEERLSVIRATYDAARAAGDENVYLLTGKDLMALAGNEGTVDNCHPNDLGFFSMANAVGEVLQNVLRLKS